MDILEDIVLTPEECLVLQGRGLWTIVAPLMGAVVGGVIGYGGTYLNQRLQNFRQKNISRMLVANNLRHWMNLVHNNICETQTHVDSDGHGGTLHREIPAFRFEASLDQVALLDAKTARKLFSLIHEKDAANSEIEGTLEYEDEENAVDIFRGRAAKLFLDSLAIYDGMAQKLGWSGEAFSERRKASMRGELERLEKLIAERGSSAQDLFADIDLPKPSTPPARRAD